MTTQNTPMSFRHRTVGLFGASLVVALLVAGCSTAQPEATQKATTTPTASATPTPSGVGSVEEPKSAEEAIKGATSAADAYFKIRAEIEVEHPADSSAIDTIAIGEAAERVHGYALDLVETGMTFEGAYTYEVTADSYASPATSPEGTVYPFGTAQLAGCFDGSGITGTNSDGTPAEMNPNRRGVLNVTAVYNAPEMRWLVQDVRTPDESVPC